MLYGRCQKADGDAADPHDFDCGTSSRVMPILNIFVPQVTQEPVTATFPFFVRVSVGLPISFFALHLKQ
jgi:hypothetical protein